MDRIAPVISIQSGIPFCAYNLFFVIVRCLDYPPNMSLFVAWQEYTRDNEDLKVFVHDICA